MTFLEKILPTEGLYCVAMAYPNGGFKHYFLDTVEDVQAKVDQLDAQGKTVFVAQASFTPEARENAEFNTGLPRGLSKEERKAQRLPERTQPNTVALRNFFFDIDCGFDKSGKVKDYETQKLAVDALKTFIGETGLPFPSIVSSGNGLYAHWAMDKDVPSTQWKTIARILKATAVAYGFRTDPMRTADSASVLRPCGATHRKDPKNLKTVTLVKEAPAIDFMSFTQLLSKAAKKKKVDVTPANAPNVADINAEFYEGISDGPPSSIVKVAEKCLQFKAFKETKWQAGEPHWYASLGVMVFCEDGQEYIHEWSSGNPNYDKAATQAKADQYLSSGAGPSTCSQFGSINPEGCIGCPHNGKIKSPIVLGRPEPIALVEETDDGSEVEPTTPQGFRRTEDGLHYEEEGRWFRFYDQDLYVDRIAFDESVGHQVAVVKHTLPHDGEMEFSLRSSLIHDPKALLTYFSDNNVHVIGAKEKKTMVAYMESHMAMLQRRQKMTLLTNQMGWKNLDTKEPLFVLGKKLFHADGRIEDASLARNVPTAASGFRSKGDLNKWVDGTKLFNKPGMEAHAFALLCGFAAPVMKFTGFGGAMISMVGESGSGKTLVLRMAQSIYGFHEALMNLRDDTRNMLISRLGVYGNLPMTVDEITNIDGVELSDLVYRVTQGRDKGRLDKNSTEKKVLNQWNTIAMVTTNSSLVDKLSGAKHDASAEMNRLFEYRVDEVEGFTGDATSDLWWTLHENFGFAGERYVGWLAQNTRRIKDDLAKVQAKIDKAAGIRGDERYWSAIAATAIYGGLVAKNLGLIKFDVGRVMAWAVKTIKEMRGEKDTLCTDAIGILGQFLDEYANNRLIVSGKTVGGAMCTILQEPRGQLVSRVEADAHRLYFGRAFFKTWLTRKYGAYGKTSRELKEAGVLMNPNRNKVLGSGTSYAGAPQPCWELDMAHPALGQVAARAVSVGAVILKEAK